MNQSLQNVEKQRDYFMKESAKWQQLYFNMRAERDHAITLLKDNHNNFFQFDNTKEASK
jgi:hypothetical protein